MKSVRLSKLVAAAAIATTISTMLPTSALAAWKQDSNGWWNTKGSSYSVGWEKIDSRWYHFKNNGYMSTGWVNDKGTWYYLAKSGAMQTGWLNDNGTWYYLSKNYGGMQTGWIKLSDVWYYLDQSGAMKTGFFNANGDTYFADQSGAMKTLWIENAGNKYFADATGAIQKGVIQIGDKIYYFDKTTGLMKTGKITIDDVEYEFAATGEAIGSKLPTPKKVYSLAGVDITKSKDKDKDEDKDSNGGNSSSGGGGGSSSKHSRPNTIVPQEVKNDYLKLVDMKAPVKNDDGSYTVAFASSINDATTEANKEDYITRDIFVTDKYGYADNVKVEPTDNGYKVSSTNGSSLTVKAVTRVLRNGTVYYLTSDEITLK